MAELALFFSAFLAATILPFSSEAALVLALENEMLPLVALSVASLGNILAISLNYTLGYLLYQRYHEKLQHSTVGKKALHVAQTHPTYALLLSWLPIIGDPITLASGLLRVNFWYFFIFAASLRVLRYIVVFLAWL